MEDVTSKKFTLKKTISWWVTHNILMIGIGYALTGTIAGGIALALLESLGENILLYIHERIWIRIAKRKNANV
jgi:uncharacterized membrane protein